MVTGWVAFRYPLNIYGRHCCRAEFSSNENATPLQGQNKAASNSGSSSPGSEELHDPPFDGCTVNTADDPPALKPVASDMVRTTWSSFGIGICTENDPFPSVNALLGIEMFRGVPKTWKCK